MRTTTTGIFIFFFYRLWWCVWTQEPADVWLVSNPPLSLYKKKEKKIYYNVHQHTEGVEFKFPSRKKKKENCYLRKNSTKEINDMHFTWRVYIYCKYTWTEKPSPISKTQGWGWNKRIFTSLLLSAFFIVFFFSWEKLVFFYFF